MISYMQRRFKNTLNARNEEKVQLKKGKKRKKERKNIFVNLLLLLVVVAVYICNIYVSHLHMWQIYCTHILPQDHYACFSITADNVSVKALCVLAPELWSNLSLKYKLPSSFCTFVINVLCK